MQLTKFITEKEQIVFPNHPALQYCGRIDFDVPDAPVFVYPYTSVKFRFTGTRVKVLLLNRRQCWDNYVGALLDGKLIKLQIPEHGTTVCLTLGENLKDEEHEIFFFKCMDSCHIFTLQGFVVDKGALISAPAPLPQRRIEVYGDSVSAGELSEAVQYTGQPDPEHHGEYSNAWYSYSAMTARKLNAQLHDIAQGGIALLHGTGWFCGPDYVGMEETYDKIEYNPELGTLKPWNFRRYTPHVVIVALGQNDSHPEDYMKEDYSSARSQNWRAHYAAFVRRLRELYPRALIILSTTILSHDESWDRSIEEVCRSLNDPKIVHFLYRKNGCGTPGHIRISEAEEMSDELSKFIRSFGEEIWRDE